MSAKIDRINCVFYTSYGNCTHLDRGRGFLWMGKPCVLHDDFSSACRKRVEHKKPVAPPPLKPGSVTGWQGCTM